jgi:hypothetical protein
MASGGVFRRPVYDGAHRDTAHENADLDFSEALGTPVSILGIATEAENAVA